MFVNAFGAGHHTRPGLLKDTERLKEEVRAKWQSHCVSAIGTAIEASLKGELEAYFHRLSIFQSSATAPPLSWSRNTPKRYFMRPALAVAFCLAENRIHPRPNRPRPRVYIFESYWTPMAIT